MRRTAQLIEEQKSIVQPVQPVVKLKRKRKPHGRKQDGHALEDWLKAEAELKARRSLRAAA